ncbi:MAG: hypothetical protein ACKV2T_32360 [Kofleriaceae bacterium]
MKRWVLAIVLAGGHANAQTAEPRPKLELPAQTLTDGDKVQFTPLTIRESRTVRDTRPFMLGGGLLVLAAIFWWNRKRRERFDRSDSLDSAVNTTRATTESREDKDDLQAAARGEQKDEG